MLVRNLTQGGLLIKGVTGKKMTLPPLKVIDIDGLEYPAERIKKHFGRYVHILTEKAEVTNEIPTKAKEDLEPKESNSVVQPANETTTKEEGDKVPSVEDNAEDVVVENVNNDVDNLDKLVDEVLEEVEEEPVKEEKETATKEEKPAKKKTGKKSSKK